MISFTIKSAGIAAVLILGLGCDSPYHAVEMRNHATDSNVRSDFVHARSMDDLRVTRERFLEDLQRRYGGTISAAGIGPHVKDDIQQADQLMREWNPLGFSRDALKSLFGSPTRETDTDVEYFFDLGMTGTGWRFTINSHNEIIAVERLLGS